MFMIEARAKPGYTVHSAQIFGREWDIVALTPEDSRADDLAEAKEIIKELMANDFDNDGENIAQYRARNINTQNVEYTA